MCNKKIYEKSFSYFIIVEREKIKLNFGDNWYKIVTEKYLKNIILEILDKPDLIMSKHTKYFWRNKMISEFGKNKIFRIFYDTPLASEGLNVNKQKYDYK
jgi:hypothetical protein